MVAPIYVELDSCYIPGIDWIGSNVVLNIVKTNINGLPILVNTVNFEWLAVLHPSSQI